MELAKRNYLFPVGLILVMWSAAAHGQWRQSSRPVENETLADLVLFGVGLPSEPRAAFVVNLTMIVAVGDPDQIDADYEFLLQVAESGEVFPASRSEDLYMSFYRAFEIEPRRDAMDGDEERRRFGDGPDRSFGGSIVTSSDGPDGAILAFAHDRALPANTQAGAIVDTRVVDPGRVLAGVRIFGTEMEHIKFINAIRTFGIASPSIAPIAAAPVFLRDGEAFASIGRFHHGANDLPVTVVVVVESHSVEVEDLHLVLIECAAGSGLAQSLTMFAPDQPMAGMSVFRRVLSQEVLKAHIKGDLSVLLRGHHSSDGPFGEGMYSSESVYHFGRSTVEAFWYEYPDAGFDPLLTLDLGFGDQPTRMVPPRPTRSTIDLSRRFPRLVPAPTGDLRVLLTGEKDGRFRAILCLQVASYTDD